MVSYKEMFDAAEKAGALKDITPLYFEFKKAGDQIIGRFRAKVEVDSSLGGGTYCQYLFDTDGGLIKFHMGAATDKEAALSMDVGKVYVIKSLGEVKISGGRTVNKFNIREIIEAGQVGGASSDDVPF